MKINIKNILFVATIVIFFIWVILRYVIRPLPLLPYLESIFYWMELILILEFVWIFKIESKMVLYFSVLLIAVGGILDVLGFESGSEAVLRISFVSLLTGAVLNLIELNQKQNS